MRSRGNSVRNLDADPLARNLCAWGWLVAGLLLLAMAAPLLAGRTYTRDDLGAFHWPMAAFYAGQLARGEPFDWMPQLFCGFYASGEGQGGFYHPLHWLAFRFLPLTVAAPCLWLASYPLMFVGAWLWLRRALRRPDAPLFGALAFAFGSFNLLHFVHPNAVAVMAHLPWLLWCIDILMTESRRGRVAAALAGLALLTASQVLCGYPQYVWFSLLAEAAYVVFVGQQRKYAARDGCDGPLTCSQCVGCAGNGWARVAIGVEIGLLIASVQLLPTVDALAHSARRFADNSFAAWGSLHPLNLLQLVSPYFYQSRTFGENTHELGMYVGAVPLALAVWAVARRRRLAQHTALIWGAAAFTVAALVLAMGAYTPLYRIQSWLPLVRCFRFPCRYLVLFNLGMAVLATLGFTVLLKQHRQSRAAGDSARPRWESFRPLWILVGLAAVVAVAGSICQGRDGIGSLAGICAGLALLGMAVGLIVAAARGTRAALIALLPLTALDLGTYGLSASIYPSDASWNGYLAAAAPTVDLSQGRVVCDLVRFDQAGLHTGNALTLLGGYRADGYAGLEPRLELDFRQLTALQQAGVRWVRRSPATETIAGLRVYDRQWLEVPDPLPRVRLVDRAEGGSASAAASVPGASVWCDAPARTQKVISCVPHAGGAEGSARLVSDRPGRLEIEVGSPHRQMFVVAERYHPGWQATVDGLPRPLVRVDGDFIGCAVEPRDRQVVLDFRPGSLRLGWLNTWLGLGLLAACVAATPIWPRPRSFRDQVLL